MLQVHGNTVNKIELAYLHLHAAGALRTGKSVHAQLHPVECSLRVYRSRNEKKKKEKFSYVAHDEQI